MMLLAALGAAWLTPARAADAPGDAAGGTVIEEVLVTGVQPEPGLWRVTRPADDGEHVLWIMGQYRTLPKEMQWKSTELEAVMAASQELLDEPEIDGGALACDLKHCSVVENSDRRV
jgi:hypothetical protein